MTQKLPPVPPANRSPKRPSEADKRTDEKARRPPQRENIEQQGQQGNTKQNTTHQGFQQDR